MEKALVMLLKAFKKEKWANEFLDGCLYCNTLSFHREKDNQEGAIVIAGSTITQYRFRIGSYDLKTVKGFTYRPNIAEHINVFCMYSWTPPFEDSAKKRVILNKETQLGSLRRLDDTYGSHAVLIGDIPEFFERLTAAVERSESQVRHATGNLVEYKLLDRIPKLDDTEDMIQLAFHKNPNYAAEKEYRFAFVLDREKPGPFRFDIGSIRDIAVQSKTRKLYDTIEINEV